MTESLPIVATRQPAYVLFSVGGEEYDPDDVVQSELMVRARSPLNTLANIGMRATVDVNVLGEDVTLDVAPLADIPHFSLSARCDDEGKLTSVLTVSCGAESTPLLSVTDPITAFLCAYPHVALHRTWEKFDKDSLFRVSGSSLNSPDGRGSFVLERPDDSCVRALLPLNPFVYHTDSFQVLFAADRDSGDSISEEEIPLLSEMSAEAIASLMLGLRSSLELP